MPYLTLYLKSLKNVISSSLAFTFPLNFLTHGLVNNSVHWLRGHESQLHIISKLIQREPTFYLNLLQFLQLSDLPPTSCFVLVPVSSFSLTSWSCETTWMNVLGHLHLQELINHANLCHEAPSTVVVLMLTPDEIWSSPVIESAERWRPLHTTLLSNFSLVASN